MFYLSLGIFFVDERLLEIGFSPTFGNDLFNSSPP
jgi:hypothetical protein